MTEDREERRAKPEGWLKGQVTFGNIVVVVMFIGAIVTWQKTTETVNQVQDIRIDALRTRLDTVDSTYARRDLSDQKLETITRQLSELAAKVDSIGRAVR